VALCTKTQVKNRLDGATSADDTLLDELIAEVGDWIADYTKRKLEPEAGATYVFDTSSGSELYIRRGIRAVTSLEVATTDQPDTGGTYSTISASLISLRPLAAERRVGWPADTILVRGTSPVFGWALAGARVTGDFGFAAVPPAIEAVAIDAVVAAVAGRQNAAGEVLGADETATDPWARYFAKGTAQLRTLQSYRGVLGIS
jgi:hypothetical protein